VTDFPLQEYVPKVFAGLGFLITLIGVGSYLQGGPVRPQAIGPKTQERTANFTSQRAANETPLVSATPRETSTPAPALPAGSQPRPANVSAGPAKQLTPAKNNAEGAYYFCGAATRKGTPCMRRVRGNVRCYQHTGQPAILQPDRLRIGP